MPIASRTLEGKGITLKKSMSAVRCARFLGLCLLMSLSESCGSDRRNPDLPDERTAAEKDEGVRSEDISVLNSFNVEKNLPVAGSTDTIIYTPAEEVKSVPTLTACAPVYQVQSSTNPFLAGMPAAAEIVYPNSTDRATVNAPSQMVPSDPKCMEAGRALYFKVDGKIAFGDLRGQESNADGIVTKVVSHTLGSVNHIATISAPINSLIGLFLDATPTLQKTTTAPALDFSTAARRDFKSLSPQLGQIFFIGDGKDTAGGMQAFVVPQGATRLYVAIMDEYEWNNNLGKLAVSASWLKP